MTTLSPHRQPWRLGPRGQWWFDLALVAALLLPLVPAAFSIGAASVALSAAQILPLLWRRRHPVAVFAAVAGASALQALAIDEPIWGQAAYPIAVYSIARYATARPAWAALAVSACGAVVGSYDWLVGIDSLTAWNFTSYVAFVAAIVSTAWALGALGRTRRAYVDALVERGERIEREAAQQVALAASDERARIAREMHDVVAHGLSVIVVQADGARYAARGEPEVTATVLESIAATGRQALTEMRRMLGLLRADDDLDLHPQPGLADLEALVAAARAAGAQVEASLPCPTRAVPDGIGLTAYRVVQEALTNVRKHAGPDVTVRVDVAIGDAVTVLVDDDGRGAAVPSDGSGLGLVGMRERVGVHGGSVEAAPRSGGGFRVAARLPL